MPQTRAIPFDTDGVELTCVIAPRPKIKNFRSGEVDTDRDTGATLVMVGLVATVNGRADMFTVSVPEPGVPTDLRVGHVVLATGLVYRHGVSDKGDKRPWEMFTARALTPVSVPEG
ncbi:MAG: hypothetical protein ACRDWG_00065 [Actinomycetes bacterium]